MNSAQRLYSRLYPSINMRITAPFLLLVLIVAGVGVFIVTRLVSGSIEERLDNQLIDSVEASSNTVTEVERGLLENLRLMVFTRTLDEAILDQDIERIQELLEPVTINALLDDVIVFGADGEGLLQLQRVSEFEFRYNARTPSDDIQNWNSVKSIVSLERDQLGDKFVEIIQIDQQPYLYMTAAVTDGDGRLVGGVSIGLAMQRLARQVSNQSLSEIVIYDLNGQVMGSAFRSVAVDQLVLPEAEAQALSEETQDQAPVRDRTYGTTPYKVAYAPFKLRSQQVGLLAVSLPSSFVADKTGTSRDMLALLFTGMFVGVAGIGVLVARSISDPVRRLVSTSRAIRAGDLSQRVGLALPDELGELSVSFDHMTEKLIERNKEINALYLAQVEQTAQRDAILSNIHDAVVVLDAEGKLFLYNHAAYHMMKSFSEQEDKYQRFWQICYSPQAYVEPKIETIGEQHFSVSGAAVQLESGAQLGYVMVFRDITAVLEAEHLKNEMIMQLSHELRTPLTAVMGYFNLVKVFSERAFEPQTQEFVTSMGRKLGVLHRMVDQVVDVTSMISGKLALDRQLFDFLTAFNEMIEQHKPAIQERQIRLLTRILPTDLWVEGDQKWLMRSIEGVLHNAYSYTLPQGNILVSLYTQNGRVMVQVEDTGVGIEPAEINKVFQLMYRGKSAEAGPTDTRGLGLGLYVAQQIMEAHKGQITLKSTPQSGTTVTLQFPINQERRA